MSNPKTLKIGDYVLATKWHDGDPLDPWAIGFYAGKSLVTNPMHIRYCVVDSEGSPIRFSELRRAQKITKQRGKWLLEKQKEIEEFAKLGSKRSLWGWLRQPMRVNV